MTKNQSLFSRFFLFLAGAGIIIFAFFLINGEQELNRIDVFVWTSISLIYLSFFIPFFFSAINIGNFSEKIPIISILWSGIILYIAASVVIIILLIKALVISLNIAIIIQAILLFLLFFDIYFAYFSGSHIRAVTGDETEKRRYISEIKSKAQIFQLSVDELPVEYENSQKILKRTLDDIKYIYPVNGNTGSELEEKILRSLDILLELVGNIKSGAHTDTIKMEIENLTILVNERKLLRN